MPCLKISWTLEDISRSLMKKYVPNKEAGFLYSSGLTKRLNHLHSEPATDNSYHIHWNTHMTERSSSDANISFVCK